jgi:hypothetical protein
MNYRVLLLLNALFCLLPFVNAQDSAATEPFAFGDFSWLNGTNRIKETPLKNDHFQAGVYFDGYYCFSLNRPQDHTLGGSTCVGRHNEFVPSHISFGLQTNYKNIIGKIYYQTGSILNLVQETDKSVKRGRNSTAGDLKNLREVSAGYHFNKWHGINLEMGIFTSLIGLESYITQENWYYQHAFVADFTPYYLTGIRTQIYPTDKLEIELQLLNGWQDYDKFNEGFGGGMSVNYRPKEWIALDGNLYYGHDTKNRPELFRFHHDHSLQMRVYNKPHSKRISKAAFCINNHYGFENNKPLLPELSKHVFIGSNAAVRLWFNQNKVGLSLRGGYVSDQGRYLALAPTEDGFIPKSTGAKEDAFAAWDAATCLDFMPNDFVTFRMEWCSRFSNVPYYAGRRGTTSIDGWQGTPGAFTPDLSKQEHRFLLAVNFRM